MASGADVIVKHVTYMLTTLRGGKPGNQTASDFGDSGVVILLWIDGPDGITVAISGMDMSMSTAILKDVRGRFCGHGVTRVVAIFAGFTPKAQSLMTCGVPMGTNDGLSLEGSCDGDSAARVVWEQWKWSEMLYGAFMHDVNYDHYTLIPPCDAVSISARDGSRAKFSISALSLPVMHTTDIMARALGAQGGRVVRYEDPHHGETFYRVVTPPDK